MATKVDKDATETVGLEEGEYIDESPPQVFLREKVGSFQKTRSYRDSRGFPVQELMEVEINRDTLLETQSEIKQKLSKFSEDLGVNFTKTEIEKKATPGHLDSQDEQYATIAQFVNDMSKDLPKVVSLE